MAWYVSIETMHISIYYMQVCMWLLNNNYIYITLPNFICKGTIPGIAHAYIVTGYCAILGCKYADLIILVVSYHIKYSKMYN